MEYLGLPADALRDAFTMRGGSEECEPRRCSTDNHSAKHGRDQQPPSPRALGLGCAVIVSLGGKSCDGKH